MEKLQEEKITIDKLAIMINKGFTEMQKDLVYLKKELESKMENLEKRMNYRFDGLQNQIDNIYLNYFQKNECDLLKNRLKKVERRVGIHSA